MEAEKQQLMFEYDKRAQDYDKSRESRFSQHATPYILNTLIPLDFDNILDMGCGTGTLLKKIINEKPQLDMYGIDFSSEMLRVAVEKLPKRVHLLEGDVEKLPFEDKKFDIVIIIDSLRLFMNPAEAIKEAYRVLKSEGKLIICDMYVTGLKKIFKDKRMLSTAEVRTLLSDAGFDVINIMENIPDGYIATGDKR